jgi:hypothetical protein
MAAEVAALLPSLAAEPDEDFDFFHERKRKHSSILQFSSEVLDLDEVGRRKFGPRAC